MACPVGLSSGDLVLVGKAFKRIYDSFRGGDDSASSQFKALCEEFDGFHTSFSHLDHALTIVGKPRPQYYHVIQSTFKKCGDLARSYEALVADRSTSMAKITKTLSWCLKDKTVENLRKSLVQHATVMTGMALALNLEMTHKLHQKQAPKIQSGVPVNAHGPEVVISNGSTDSVPLSGADLDPRELQRLINSMAMQMESLSQRIAEADDCLRRYSTTVDSINSTSTPSTPQTIARSPALSGSTYSAELNLPLRTEIRSELHSCIQRLIQCDKLQSTPRSYSYDSAYGSLIGGIGSQQSSPHLTPMFSNDFMSPNSPVASHSARSSRRATLNSRPQSILLPLSNNRQSVDSVFLEQNVDLPPAALESPSPMESHFFGAPENFSSPSDLVLPPAVIAELPGSLPASMSHYSQLNDENASHRPMTVNTALIQDSIPPGAANWEYFCDIAKSRPQNHCNRCGPKCPSTIMEICKEGEWLCALQIVCRQSQKIVSTQSFSGSARLSPYIAPPVARDNGKLRVQFRQRVGSRTPQIGEANLPSYDFINETDFNKFQELVSCRKLLHSCDVREISGDVDRECRAETLQLWGELDSNITYLRFYSSLRRKEFFEEPKTSFRDPEKKSGDRVRLTILKLSPPPSRRGSIDTVGSTGSARSRGSGSSVRPLKFLDISFYSPQARDDFLRAWKCK